jgi:phosphatidylglycerophosphatase B
MKPDSPRTNGARRTVFLTAAALLIALIWTAWNTALPFSAWQENHSLATFWLFISDSGAEIGVATVAILSTFVIILHHGGRKHGAKKGMIFFLGISILLGTLALSNEFLVKPNVAAQRPSILKLEALEILNADALYSLDGKPKRREYMAKSFTAHPHRMKTAKIHPKILHHWMVETGFSLPSGHSQNAFVFGTLLAFLLLRILVRMRWIFVIPLLWATGIAISRVAVGAHSPLDITVGSLIGFTVAMLIIWLGLPDRLLKRSDSAQ